MLDARALIGSHDLLMITLDTLRLDVAQTAMTRGMTPNFQEVLPQGRWEERHTSATFTYAAHQAFFAGFLPTPTANGPHERLFAARFPGSETTGDRTFVFDAPDMVSGLAALGYRTICIGGVGFFNKQSALGTVLPSLFHESHWHENLGVTSPQSTENQVATAVSAMSKLSPEQKVFLFINVSALHQPNCIFTPGATVDTKETQAQALSYVDRHLGDLFQFMQKRRPLLCIICSDHGTAYGEDGYSGHRNPHPTVWNVPYAEFVLGGSR